MPDYGGQFWIERSLEQIEAPSFGDEPSPDYGTALLETSATQHHHLSGGRKLSGGIMFLPTYKGPTVNIRAPKWTDNTFWIRAPDLEVAQWIADAIYYHTGRRPFHFRRPFNYPPLLLGTGQYLKTREKCALHVAKIAKGAALLGERGDYRVRVKKLVLEAVKHPEVVRFLSSMRLMARPAPPIAITIPAREEAAMEADPLSEEETRTPIAVDPSSEEDARTPMEVDPLSEEVVRLLAPPVQHVDAATLFRAADTTTFEEPVDMSTAFIAGFAMDVDDNLLHSFGQSITTAKAKIPSNLAPLLKDLDEEENDAFKCIELSAWEPFSSPRSKEPSYTFRF
jgi:hypothetical protein